MLSSLSVMSRCQHVLVKAEKAVEYVNCELCALSYGLTKQACCLAVALCVQEPYVSPEAVLSTTMVRGIGR